MIRRTLNGTHFLTTQPEHARQTGVIVAHLRDEFLGPAEQQVDLLRATAVHDIGWAEWDANPTFAPNGLPLDFLDLPRLEHLEIWRRTIFGMLTKLGPAAAATLARHASALTTKEPNPSDPDYHFADLIPALRQRAWPGVADEDTAFFVERGFLALRLADGLSLMGCAGWEALEMNLLREDRTPYQVMAWRDGDFSIRVDPWPFAPPEINDVWFEAVAIPEGSEPDAATILKHPREQRMRLPVRIAPK